MILRNNPISVVIVFFFAIQITAQTKIIAHRGASGDAPENTWIAFQKAIDSGADYFELDVHKSKDGKLYVIHDDSVDRTSSNGEKGKIYKLTSQEIDRIPVGYPKMFGDTYKNERIPTLEDILKLAKGKIKVCIEIKIFGIEKEVLKLINDLEMKEEVYIFSFYFTVLAKIRQLDKEIPILLLHSKYLVDETTIDYASVINANAIGINYDSPINKKLIALAHQHGIEVWKYTVDEENLLLELLDMGIDGVITNYPEETLKIIKEKKITKID